MIAFANDKKDNKDWRTTRMVEDYMNFASDLMVPHVTYGQYGSKRVHFKHQPPSLRYQAKSEFHVERPTLLGAVTSPVRRALAFETWSPREIIIFEGYKPPNASTDQIELNVTRRTRLTR